MTFITHPCFVSSYSSEFQFNYFLRKKKSMKDFLEHLRTSRKSAFLVRWHPKKLYPFYGFLYPPVIMDQLFLLPWPGKNLDIKSLSSLKYFSTWVCFPGDSGKWHFLPNLQCNSVLRKLSRKMQFILTLSIQQKSFSIRTCWLHPYQHWFEGLSM